MPVIDIIISFGNQLILMEIKGIFHVRNRLKHPYDKKKLERGAVGYLLPQIQ